MMAMLTIAVMLLLPSTNLATNFLCSSTGDENGTALSGNVCRNATTVCEEDAVCDGTLLACPENAFKPNTTIARAAVTLCDKVEMCSGIDNVVPADAFQPKGFTIHPAVSVCDVEDSCSGVDAVIPDDTFQPAGTVIRASTSTDDCDPAEVCNGMNASVPPDVDNCVKVAVDVLGRSGKFSIFDESVGKEDPNTVTVEVDALRELDADGAEVGKSGSVKHSIETFASQDFTIHPAESAKIGEVSATMIAFDTPISTIGRLSVNTYILKNSGTVGTDTETWAVRANDVKFNIALSEWKWCGEASDCKQGGTTQNGEYIDVDIKIKGKAAKPERNGSSKDYDLGADVGLDLSDRVFVDGAWTTMPAGFPKMELKGGSAIFTFRFPKFDQEAMYDPVVEFADSLPDKPLGVVTTSSTTTTTVPSGGSSSRLLQNEARTASKRRARTGDESRHQTFLAASMLEIRQKPRKERMEKHTEF